MPATLYTFGYQGHKFDELRKCVDDLGAIVLDVRLNAWSPNPTWQKSTLTRLLGERYQAVGEYMGNVNHKTEGAPIALKDERATVQYLSRALQPDNPAIILLCACADAKDCHRSYIAKGMQAAVGCVIVDLPRPPEQTVKMGRLFDPPLETYRTEAEINGFQETQGGLL